MGELLIISIVGGVVSGLIASVVGGLVLHFFGSLFARSIDLDIYYQELDEFKREVHSNSEEAPIELRTLLVRYGIGVGLIMVILLPVILSLVPDFGAAAVVAIPTWLFVASIPLIAIVFLKLKQIVLLEIASLLRRIAQNPDENGEVWVIHASKMVSGGDLLGPDEEDWLDLRISRTDVAPVVLHLHGHVIVAEAGLERTVKKSGLRQLRIKGWLVNEIRDTEVEIEHQWSLHNSTYADIANDLAWIVESLGFSLRNVRLTQIQPAASESLSSLKIDVEDNSVRKFNISN